MEFLAQKYVQPQEPSQKRVLGLNQDKIWISDNFNNPLPDEFWLGESQG